MIEITETAQEHFRRLLAQQGDADTGIMLRVTEPGSPQASCALEFCEPADLAGDEWQIECIGFVLYVESAAAAALDRARIDYQTSKTGGQLNIAAPNLRGAAPGEDASLVARIQYLLDSEINPKLASHGGHVRLREVDADGVVLLQFGGGCHGCGMADVTLKQGVEKTLRQHFPQITAVRDVTDHASGANPFYQGKQSGAHSPVG